MALEALEQNTRLYAAPVERRSRASHTLLRTLGAGAMIAGPTRACRCALSGASRSIVSVFGARHVRQWDHSFAMLTAVDNELLTRTGSGTAMGEYFRRFWQPIALSAELAQPDCAPIRVRVMGEDLVAFRDTHGKVGLIEPHCPHRGANLFFGRNEEGGIRCVYHGWKFDVNGNCVDMPSVPPPDFKHKLRAKAYPAVETGGVIWVYMGAHAVPELPAFEILDMPADEVRVAFVMRSCNYLQ